VTAVAFAPGADLPAYGLDDGRVFVPSATGGDYLALDGNLTSVQDITFDAEGALLAGAGSEGQIIVWSARAQVEVGGVSGAHAGEVESLDFHPSEARLLSSGDDGVMRLWGVESVQGGRVRLVLQEELRGHVGSVLDVAFSPDGTLIASAGREGTVRLWSVPQVDADEGGRELAVLTGHHDRVRSVSFSPDGALLASSGDDGGVRVWDVRTGRPVVALQSAMSLGVRTSSVAFSADGRQVVSASDDGRIWLWDMDASSWVRGACSRANRTLTDDEREEHFQGVKLPAVCRDF